MLRLIYYSLSKRWVQTVATLLTVAISVAMFFSLYLVYFGVTNGLDTGEKRLGADLLVVPKGAESVLESDELLFSGAPICMYMNEEYLGKISKVSGVNNVTPQFFAQTLSNSCCTTGAETRLIGFDSSSDWIVNSWLEKGNKISLNNNEVVVGSDVDGFEGDAASILGEKFTIKQRLQPTGTSLDYSILLNINAARKISGKNLEFQHFWKRYGKVDELISAVLVSIDKDRKTEIIREIEKLGDFKVIASSDLIKDIRSQMDVLFMITLICGVLTVVVTGVQLFARFFSLAWDRKGEWGLYRALGAKKSDLKILIIGEALVLSISGAIIGLITGYGLYKMLLHFLKSQRVFPFIPVVGLDILLGLGSIMLLFIVIGIVSAWVPAYKSSKIEPSVAMSKSDID